MLHTSPQHETRLIIPSWGPGLRTDNSHTLRVNDHEREERGEPSVTRVSTLRERLEQLSDDSIERIDALNDLSETYLAGDPQAMFSLSEEAIEMARRLGYARGEAYGLFYRGAAQWLVARLELALVTFLEADTTFLELDDASGRAKVRCFVGAVYRSLGDYDQAFLEGLDPVEYFASQADSKWEALARLSIAMTSHELADFEGARRQYEKVLELREGSDEQWLVGRALSGIGARSRRHEQSSRSAALPSPGAQDL